VRALHRPVLAAIRVLAASTLLAMSIPVLASTLLAMSIPVLASTLLYERTGMDERERDGRWHDYLRFRSRGWTAIEAAWSAYYGQPWYPARPVRPAWLYDGRTA
jgi:hypothetical protein